MRVLLRHRCSKMYVGRQSEAWVHRDDAQNYDHVFSAIEAAQELPAKSELEVLLCFDDPRYDITLPIHS
jgi:hypothetical protein